MEISEALRSLSALSQETRLAAFRLLVEAGREGLAAGQIAEALDVPPATLSFHLSHLASAGLVGMRRRGRSIIYHADYATMTGLMAYLTENCCQGADDCGVPARPGGLDCSNEKEVSHR